MVPPLVVIIQADMKQIISHLTYYLIICDLIYIEQVLDKLPKKNI